MAPAVWVGGTPTFPVGEPWLKVSPGSSSRKRLGSPGATPTTLATSELSVGAPGHGGTTLTISTETVVLPALLGSTLKVPEPTMIWLGGVTIEKGSSESRRISWLAPGVRFQNVSVISTTTSNATPAFWAAGVPVRPLPVEPVTLVSPGTMARSLVGLLGFRVNPPLTVAPSDGSWPLWSVAVMVLAPALRSRILLTVTLPPVMLKNPTLGAKGSLEVILMLSRLTVVTML